MIIEIVRFTLPDGITRADVVENFVTTADEWKNNPDLLRKNCVVDMERRTAGGVYLWNSRADADKWHGADFTARIMDAFGSEPTREFFDSPVVIDNVTDQIITE